MSKIFVIFFAVLSVLCAFAAIDAQTTLEMLWAIGLAIGTAGMSGAIYYYEYVKT